MAFPDQLPYLLPEEESQKIYEQFVRRSLVRAQTFPQDNPPVAYYLAAQPGSGKTKLRMTLQHNGIVVINTDDFRWYHPRYTELLQNPLTNERGAYLVNPDATNWSVRLTQEAIENRRSIIVDSTLGGTVDHYIERFQQLHGLGYRIEIHAIGVRRMVSRLGIYLRYETNRQQAPERMVSMAVHDRNYHALPINLQRLHDVCENLISSISIYSRGQARELNRSYHTEFPCDIDAAINELNTIRNAPFTLDDTLSFNSTTTQVRQMIEARGANPQQFLDDVRLWV